ncbi:phosphoglucosamine mutase [Longirhabdus pacifica]|uniref:phosphoglucosamine mutase n=1 Tax=Longirhabdus pacifica TaxID=2305227 RepID=UPI001008A1D8|nr:phosphoglucosamine mutase [Longirhabdus pacifica]
MGKYFGTDGVRGIANKELTPELAFKIGRCGGYVLAGKVKKPQIVIGRDTRISGSMLESALVAGLLSIGADCVRLGVVTTPCVAHVTKQLNADAGVMISASHNPIPDNGIKFFGGDGFKLSDETELLIEQCLDSDEDTLPRPIGDKMGAVTDLDSAKFDYIHDLENAIQTTFTGLKIVLDGANGSAYELAPYVFEKLGAEVIKIACEPDGLNINEECGSTHIDHLKAEVKAHGADLGLAFDGDADRLIAVDEHAEELDGDYILAIIGQQLHEQGKLNHGTIVSTVMSNIGFYKAVDELGMQTKQTAVGDRYVMEEMRKGGYNLGGEQSGHVIFLDHSTTGDGILTALKLVEAMVLTQKPLSQLRHIMQKYPQVLVNVKGVQKDGWQENEKINEVISGVEYKLGNEGRVLVRASGTEPLIRVMAEGKDSAVVEQYVTEIVETIKDEISLT